MELGRKYSVAFFLSAACLASGMTQAETKFRLTENGKAYGEASDREVKVSEQALVQMCSERKDGKFDTTKAINELCKGVDDPDDEIDLMFAQAKRFKFDLGRDEDGNIRPEGNIALYWTKNFYTEFNIAHTNQTTTAETEIENVGDLKKAVSFDEGRYTLKVLGYEEHFNDNESFSVGFEYERTEHSRNEFGYVEILPTIQVTDDLIAFDNTVDLTVDRMALSADMFFFVGENLKFKIDGSYFLYNRLKVDQELEWAKVTQQGVANSVTKQDDAYELAFEASYMLDNGFGVGFNHNHSFRSFEYDAVDVSALNQFDTTTVKTEGTTSHSQVRLFLGDFLGDMVTSINYSIINTETKDLNNNSSAEDDYNVISIGLNGRF